MDLQQDPFAEFGGNSIQQDPFQEFGGVIAGPPTKVPAKQFISDYISSPIYRQRLSNFTDSQQPDIKNILNTKLSQVNGPGSIAYNQQSATKTDTKHAGFPIVQGKSNINIDRGQIGYINKQYGVDQTPDSILAHELSHVTRNLSPNEENLIAGLNKKPDEAKAFQEYKKLDLSNTFSDYLNTAYSGTHDARPSEIKADLDALRFKMFKNGIYDTSKRDMTIDDFNKASQNKEIQNSLEFKRLKERFKPADLIKLNNTIASNNHSNESDKNMA